MSATDELRRLLDERGVPYETNDDMGASETRWNGFTAYQLTPNAKLVMHPTPEQAIAATLGSDASAVRLAERLRSIAYEMRSVGASSMTPHELLACYANDVEKVADSLMSAATLGNSRAERTCNLIENGDLLHCSNCGSAAAKQSWAYWIYCPNCGCKVVSE